MTNIIEYQEIITSLEELGNSDLSEPVKNALLHGLNRAIDIADIGIKSPDGFFINLNNDQNLATINFKLEGTSGFDAFDIDLSNVENLFDFFQALELQVIRLYGVNGKLKNTNNIQMQSTNPIITNEITRLSTILGIITSDNQVYVNEKTSTNSTLNAGMIDSPFAAVNFLLSTFVFKIFGIKEFDINSPIFQDILKRFKIKGANKLGYSAVEVNVKNIGKDESLDNKYDVTQLTLMEGFNVEFDGTSQELLELILKMHEEYEDKGSNLKTIENNFVMDLSYLKKYPEISTPKLEAIVDSASKGVDDLTKSEKEIIYNEFNNNIGDLHIIRKSGNTFFISSDGQIKVLENGNNLNELTKQQFVESIGSNGRIPLLNSTNKIEIDIDPKGNIIIEFLSNNRKLGRIDILKSINSDLQYIPPINKKDLQILRTA